MKGSTYYHKSDADSDSRRKRKVIIMCVTLGIRFAYVIYACAIKNYTCQWAQKCNTVPQPEAGVTRIERQWFSSSLPQVRRSVQNANIPSQHELAYEPPVTIYMGRDKVESSYDSSLASSSWTYWHAPDEDLIKYAWPQDVWFHVDKLSSAHVYLRLPESIASWEAIPDALLVDCAQLVKANSIEGESRIVSPFIVFKLGRFRQQTQ